MNDPSSAGGDALALCRQDIDRIDAVLVALLRERTRLALAAGALKRAGGQEIHSPEREASVLSRVRQLAGGPLDPAAAARIFACIIEESRTTEEGGGTS